MSINRWMDKRRCVMCTHTHTHTPTHNGILLGHKKEQNDAICSNMDGPTDCHTEWYKSDTERQTFVFVT